MALTDLNLFWDNSNIWIVGQNVCSIREPGNEFEFRIHFSNLFYYVCQNRTVNYAFLAGSIPPENDAVWNRFKSLGIEVDRQERGAGGGEIAVDEAIQLAMANRIIDCDSPETMVLLTGDGAGYTQGRRFVKQLERAMKKGWNIEIVSWDIGINRRLKDFATRNGTYIQLEVAYDDITFINNKRWANRL